MAKKFGVSIDLEKFEILNARIQNLGAAPGAPVVGQIYYDTNLEKFRIWDGDEWLDCSVRLATGARDGLMSSADFTKLAGIEAGATQDQTKSEIDALGIDAATVGGQTPANLRDRATHTGTQLAATISDFDTQVRTSRLDQMAAPNVALGMNAQRIINVADPQNAQDVATKAYVDAARMGLDVKASVRLASTGPIDLATGTLIEVDGVQTVADDRILVKNQAVASENGFYLAKAGTWVRTEDADSSGEVTPGMFTFVEEGDTLDNTGWVLTTNGPINLGATDLTFAQFSGTGTLNAGAGMSQAGNTFNVGAGTGIEVLADTVGILAGGVGTTQLADEAVTLAKLSLALQALLADMVQQVVYTIGDGAATQYACAHTFTRDCSVTVYRNSAPYDEPIVDVLHTDDTTVTIGFGAPVPVNAYKVVIQGVPA